MSEVLTYVYCLVRSGRRPALRRVPSGMPGSGGPRVLDAGAHLWAIVTTVPAGDYGEAGLTIGLQDLEWVGNRAMAHESVVEHFLAAGAVLPMQLFTLFTSDARALEHVAKDRERIERIVDRIEGRLEWGLRLSFDPKAAKPGGVSRPAASRRADADGRRAAGAPGLASGASYLARKRDVLHASRLQLAEARKEADRLYALLSGEAAEACRRTAIEQALPGSRVVLDAAFLVPVKRAGAFAKAVRERTRHLGGSGVAVSLTGPWPAYNFIDTPHGGGANATKRPTPRTRTTTRARVSKAAATRAPSKQASRRRL